VPCPVTCVVSHWEYSFRSHIQHRPHAMVKGTTTRSPTVSPEALPASTTRPMGSWPMMSPGSMKGPRTS